MAFILLAAQVENPGTYFWFLEYLLNTKITEVTELKTHFDNLTLINADNVGYQVQ